MTMRKGEVRKPKAEHEGRCSGHCCARFTIPYSPEDLEHAYTRVRRDLKGRGAGLEMNSPFEGKLAARPLLAEIEIVFPMMRYLGRGRDVAPEFVYPLAGEGVDDLHYYTCTHWDPESGDCEIHDHRPQMCREYPYHTDCNYADCTWGERKARKREVVPSETLAEKARARKLPGLPKELLDAVELAGKVR